MPTYDDEPAVPSGDGGLVRVRLAIAYDGGGFSGWAAQPGRRTVQGELEEALARILRVPVALTVAGRTDAGVHAAGQVAHADVPARCGPGSGGGPPPDSGRGARAGRAGAAAGPGAAAGRPGPGGASRRRPGSTRGSPRSGDGTRTGWWTSRPRPTRCAGTTR